MPAGLGKEISSVRNVEPFCCKEGRTFAEIAGTMSDKHFEIAVMLHDAAWDEHLKELESLAKRAMRAAWRRLHQDWPEASSAAAEVSLVFADDAAVAELNRGYRGREGPTNVLSFPNMDDEDFVAANPAGAASARPRLLGDVVLARQTVLREAGEQGKSLHDHTLHLLVHGLLHLLGHDHESAAEAEEMEALETAILADLGIADPYRPPVAEAQASPDPQAGGGE